MKLPERKTFLENPEMALTEHLSELRKRILVSLSFLLITFMFIFNYSEEIFKILTFPLKTELMVNMNKPYLHIREKAAPPLVFFAVGEAFWMHLKISFVSAFIVSLPVIFHQLWGFISPGLHAGEKKYVLPFVMFATMLFLIGALFCFSIILPFAITFLLGYKTAAFTPMLSVEKYIDFCLKFILAFGAVFELPLVIIFLTRSGFVSPNTLAKQRKYAVLFSFVAAAVLTPTPDAFNQTLMAVPIIILYEIGIILSRIIYRKRKHD